MKTKNDIQNNNVIKNLKYYRAKNNLTQEVVAKQLGISRATYTYYENGKTVPSIFTLYKLAVLYGVKMEDFFR